MTLKVGSSIYVQPSDSLGTPAVWATVLEIVHEPHPDYYPLGLYRVLCEDELNMAPALQGGTTVDAEGYVYSGPPHKNHAGHYTLVKFI